MQVDGKGRHKRGHRFTREEINWITPGGNYGYPYREGSLGGPQGSSTPVGFESTNPIFELNRQTGGQTVIGGIVYRGSAISFLTGKYVFAEFGRQISSGQQGTAARLFYADLRTGELFEFGIDPAGEVLATEVESPETARRKAKYAFATDGQSIEAENLIEGKTLVCEFADIAAIVAITSS